MVHPANGSRRYGVAPRYYKDLAMMYRKENRRGKELEILERYQKQPYARGQQSQELKDRLKRLRDSDSELSGQ